MELQTGELYQCRRKKYIACVTDDVSQNDKLYKYKGYVFDENTGDFVRKICMWTASGNYSIDNQTDFDIISMFKNSPLEKNIQNGINNKKQIECCSYCGKSSCNGSCS